MLSDREREKLSEIERRFLVEDPDLVHSFQVAQRRLQHDAYWLAYTIMIVASGLLSVLMLAAGVPSGALVFAAVAGALWVARRH